MAALKHISSTTCSRRRRRPTSRAWTPQATTCRRAPLWTPRGSATPAPASASTRSSTRSAETCRQRSTPKQGSTRGSGWRGKYHLTWGCRTPQPTSRPRTWAPTSCLTTQRTGADRRVQGPRDPRGVQGASSPAATETGRVAVRAKQRAATARLRTVVRVVEATLAVGAEELEQPGATSRPATRRSRPCSRAWDPKHSARL
mmetsp:Transcript_86270/g.192921  ORF Transcript_86270/g.192921 Transcript_86270/m.192921 type:complete len:201 (+) Transcript_86270:384-986(+)